MTNLSNVSYTGDNSTVSFSIGAITYLDTAHIKASLDGVDTVDFTFSTPNVVFDTAPGTGVAIKLYRDTPRTLAGRLVDFTDSSTLSETDLDTSAIQLLYIAQEAYERGNASGADAILYSDSLVGYNANSKQIKAIADPTATQDAATKAYVDAASADHMTKVAGEWDGETLKITDILDPAANQDAATKYYVDQVAAWGSAGMAQALSFAVTTGTNTYTLTGMEYVDATMLVVAIEGVLQIPGTDYTVVSASPNSSIVFLNALVTSDIASVQNFGKKLYIAASSIADGSITTAKVADEAITNAKLSADSVDNDQIVTGAVSLEKIANDGVTTVHITDANVTTAKIADDAITTAKILDDNVTNAKIAAGSIDLTQLKSVFTTGGGGAYPRFLQVDPSTGVITLDTLSIFDTDDLLVVLAALTLNNLGAPTGSLNLNSQKITNLADPTNAQDAVTKTWAEAQFSTDVQKGPKLLFDQTVGTATANIEFTGLYDAVAAYNRYEVVFQGVKLELGSGIAPYSIDLLMQGEADVAYTATGYQFRGDYKSFAGSGSDASWASTGATAITLLDDLFEVALPISGVIQIINHTSDATAVDYFPSGSGKFSGGMTVGGSAMGNMDIGFSNPGMTSKLDQLKFTMNTGNFETGSRIQVYGYKD